MSSPCQAPNFLSEAIAIASGLMDIPPTKEHFSALLGAIPANDAQNYLAGKKRCLGCAEWKPAAKVPQCQTCPDSYCKECGEDHREYCK